MESERSCNNGTLRYRVAVLGCKVNQYEAEQIRTLLSRCGFIAAIEDESPDVVVIHSCAVTAESVRKLRSTIRRQAGTSPQARIIVTGCAAKEGLVEAQLPEHTYVRPGSGWIGRLAVALSSDSPKVAEDSATLVDDIMGISEFSGHHRAFLKIQDGCDNSCSYCIVPSLRGPSRDKPLENIFDEVAALVANGHREIILSGVNVGLYGRRADIGLLNVVDSVARIEGVERLRVSSLHPIDLTEEFLSVLAKHANIMPHIHLPLQSGSDRILRQMRRGYSRDEFMQAVERARSMLDEPAFNTDIIVGFPGETESDFQDTLAICRQVGFSRMHVFRYSPRPGTDAAEMRYADDRAVSKERLKQVRELASSLSLDFHRSRTGKDGRVLAETYDEESHSCQGYTERYIPVTFPAQREDAGKIIPVRLDIASASGMTARKSQFRMNKDMGWY